MWGVADDGQLRNATMQLNGNLPHRRITVDFLLVRRKATMNSSQTLDTSLIQTLQGTNPEFQIGIDGVLHEYRDIDTF